MRLLTTCVLLLCLAAVATAQSSVTSLPISSSASSIVQPASDPTSAVNDSLNSLNGILSSLGFGNISLPPAVLSVLSVLPLQNLGSLDFNGILNALPQDFLLQIAGLAYSVNDPACQSALMAYQNITSICLATFNDAATQLQSSAQDAAQSALLNSNANGTVSINTTDLRWGQVCSQNGPICLRALQNQVNNIGQVCGTTIFNSIDFSQATTYWNDILCSQNADGVFCYPAFVSVLNYLNNRTVPDLSGAQITEFCNDCTYKVLAGYSLLPNGYNLTGALPLVCASIGEDYCLDPIRSLASSSNSTDALGKGQDLICSPCAQKIWSELHYVTGIDSELSTFQSLFPCLGGNLTSSNPQLQYCWSQIDSVYPGTSTAPTLLTSPLLQAIQPCLSDFTSGSCSASCKAALQPLSDKAGCCFSTALGSIISTLPSAVSSLVPNQASLTQFISSACGLSITSGSCPVASSSSMTTAPTMQQGVITTVNIPNLAYSWVSASDANKATLQNALQSDLALASGGQVSSIIPQSVSAYETTGTQVVALLPAADAATAQQYQTAFNTALSAAGALSTPNLAALPSEARVNQASAISIASGNAVLNTEASASSSMASLPMSSGAGSIPTGSSMASSDMTSVSTSVPVVASSLPASSIVTPPTTTKVTDVSPAASHSLSLLGMAAMAVPVLALVL